MIVKAKWQSTNMKIVIRAGGVGSRLWPMSRQNHPKQFQAFVGEQTMLATTYARVKDLVGSDNIFVSVNQSCLEKLKAELPDLKPENIIIETDARNTGPAMCLETLWLSQRCEPDEVIASLPSDDYISDIEAFHNLLKLSADFIAEHPDYILTPAVRPSVLDTGYSYFKVGKNLSELGQETIYEVAGVAEKPNADYCQELIDSGVYYCHTGMYIWRLGYIEKLFAELQPEMHKTCQQAAGLTLAGDLAGAAEHYGNLEKATIESCITNKAPRLAMSVSDRIGWSDLGKWPIIKKMLSAEGFNLLKGRVVEQGAKNCLVYNNNEKKIIVLNDVEDLAVVETEDALLISSLKKAADIKEVLEKLPDNYL